MLDVTALEDRWVPATFGTPWPDPERLTLSFADGATIAGSTSSLANVSQREILAAFQAWADVAGINIAVVEDYAAPFGTSGAIQGDPRFGDIRIGGIPLGSDVYAITSPYSIFDPYAGDVVLNTAAGYGSLSGPDLRTVLLQEAGHALGLGNSALLASVMYEYYRGPRSGLSPEDIAAIRNLYGARTPDNYERSNGNDSLSNATVYTSIVQADITTSSDADVYRFSTGLLSSGITVKLNAKGLSLLNACVELLSSNGTVLATAAVYDPLANDITLSYSGAQSLRNYYVRVTANDVSEFRTGAYTLEINEQSLLSTVTGVLGWLVNETGLNDTLASAVNLLSSTSQISGQTEFRTTGRFGSASDVDVYRLTLPPSSAASTNLVVTVWGESGARLFPTVQLLDATGQAITVETLNANGQTTTLQARNLMPGQTYFLKLATEAGAIGDYTLAADLTGQVVMTPDRVAGVASAATEAQLHVSQSGFVRIIAQAANAAFDIELIGANGMIQTLAVPAGRARSADWLLNAGQFRVRIVPHGTAAFEMAVVSTSDPVGARPTDPTDAPTTDDGSSPAPPPRVEDGRAAEVTIDPVDDGDEAMWY